jgi:hypothetical protein
MAYVYKHIRKDTNEVFYIGIGSDTLGKYTRAFDKNSRNRYWNFLTKKTDYIVEIVEDNLTWDVACKCEIELIKKYGRKDLSEGTLVNMTDGGDGTTGQIISDTHKQSISNKLKGIPLSSVVREKMSNAHKGKIISKEQRLKLSNYFKNKPLSDAHKLNISKSVSGSKNGFFGKKHSEESKEKMKNTRNPLSNEHKRKLSEVGIGKKHSEETKQKMRDARIKYYQNKFGNME